MESYVTLRIGQCDFNTKVYETNFEIQCYSANLAEQVRQTN